MQRIVEKFAGEAVAALDATSPSKLRGDILQNESNQIDAKIEQMDVRDFLRQVEMKMLSNEQLLRDMDDGVYEGPNFMYDSMS